MIPRFIFFATLLCCLGGLFGDGVDGVNHRQAYANLLQSPTTTGGFVGSCSQSTAFVNRARTAYGGTLPSSPAYESTYDTMICGMVTDTVWATLDALWAPGLAPTAAVANLNLVSSSFTLIPIGSPTFTANAGYTGGADLNNTVALNTQFTPSTNGVQYTLNAAHISTWQLTSSQSTGFACTLCVADSGGANQSGILPYDSSSGDLIGINQGSGYSAAGSVTTAHGSYVGVRISSAAGGYTFYRDGASRGLVGGGVSTALPAAAVYLLNGNNSGTIGSSGSALQLAAASIGGILNATSAPAVSSSGGTTGTGLVPRLCSALTTIHGSC